jgi:predicted  nucleic acid-binding Zn-ribbon protein
LHEVLKQLIELQAYDAKLAHIESLKGDLPMQVKRLDEELNAQKARLTADEERYQQVQKERGICEMEVMELEGKQSKYQSQLFEVKTNREYDAITHELEALQQTKSEKETRILELLDLESEIKERVAHLKEDIVALESNLGSKAKALKERMAETEKDEIRFKDKRDQILKRLKPQIVGNYERIRRAKGGMAVVSVDRGACGGCQIALPPQKILEVRKMDRIHLCEVCGRILVWVEEAVKTT